MPDYLPCWFLPAACALIGACIGSFLNVVIYRLPRNLSINEPKRSFCPACKKSIPWYRNIPVASWLILRGKCANCHSRISFRYWIVEVMTALLFAAAAYVCRDESPLLLVPLLGWTAMGIAIAFIDAEHMIVFPRDTVIAGLLGVSAALLSPPWMEELPFLTERLEASFIGAAAGYIGIRLVIELGKKLFGTWKRDFPVGSRWELREPSTDEEELTLVLPDGDYTWSDLFSRDSDRAIFTVAQLEIDGSSVPGDTFTLYQNRIVSGDGTIFLIESIKSASGTLEHIQANREAMGYGDAWIMMMIGALCGWEGVLFCLVAGSLTGIIAGLAGRIGFGKPIPFGPCLLFAAAIWILGGYKLWAWYCEWLLVPL